MLRAGTKRGTIYTARRFSAKPITIRRRRPDTLESKVRALVKGKTKDTVSVARSATLTTTTVSCLTSGTDFAVATNGTGLFSVNADEVMMNSLDLNEVIELQGLEDVTPVGLTAAVVRTIIVYFYAAYLPASAAGTLPPITEVLETDAVASLVVPDTQKKGRFKILYDKTTTLGSNTVAVAATGAYPRIAGNNIHTLNTTLKLGLPCKFKAEANSDGSIEGGHYDSDEPGGQVSTGLLCMYRVGKNHSTAGTTVVTCNTRINYTG